MHRFCRWRFGLGGIPKFKSVPRAPRHLSFEASFWLRSFWGSVIYLKFVLVITWYVSAIVSDLAIDPACCKNVTNILPSTFRPNEKLIEPRVMDNWSRETYFSKEWWVSPRKKYTWFLNCIFITLSRRIWSSAPGVPMMYPSKGRLASGQSSR